jgi:small subunit ribosomal protein S1
VKRPTSPSATRSRSILRAAENARGEAVISREMARREEAWDRLEKAYADDARVEGAIFGRVKGGFTVDLGGAVAFLPGSRSMCAPCATPAR